MRAALPLVLLFFLGEPGACGSDTTFKSLYDRHRWFELRDAIQGKSAPPLYVGAVASAFNKVTDAEKYLNQAIRQASNPAEADEAREMLATLYMRLGKSREAVGLFDELLKERPGRSDVRNVRALLAAFSRYPNQSIGLSHHATLRCTVGSGGLWIPLSLNGKNLNWFLDTGLNTSGVSESEAQMLGLAVQDASGQASDSAGGSVRVRTTVAGRLIIGGAEFRNVPLVVFPDSQPPWNGLAPGKRGAIGLPVVSAFQTFRWTADGTCEAGFAGSRNATGEGNLSFDGLAPVTRVQFENRELDFILDTGNQAGTELWSRFSGDFTTLLNERGKPATKRVVEVGGSNERPAIVLPEIRLVIGGLQTTLRPASVYSKPVGNDFQHGLLGMDLLSQAREVRIDFRSMSVALR